jgi:hypothetical protein
LASDEEARFEHADKASRPALKFAVGVFLVPTLLFGLWAYFSYLTPFFAARVSKSDVTFGIGFPSSCDSSAHASTGGQRPWRENSPWVPDRLYEGWADFEVRHQIRAVRGLKNGIQPIERARPVVQVSYQRRWR